MNNQTEEIESSQRQHHEVLLHNQKTCNENELHAYNKFKSLECSLQKDGNQWCVLFGKDLQSGIAGFGDTPNDAIIAWDRSMCTEKAVSNG